MSTGSIVLVAAPQQQQHTHAQSQTNLQRLGYEDAKDVESLASRFNLGARGRQRRWEQPSRALHVEPDGFG